MSYDDDDDDYVQVYIVQVCASSTCEFSMVMCSVTSVCVFVCVVCNALTLEALT